MCSDPVKQGDPTGGVHRDPEGLVGVRGRRPAGTDILDEHTIPIGVPACVAGDFEWHGQPYYVVKMEQTMAVLDRSTWNASPQALRPIPFENLKLGPILGKGSFGRVYRGIYNGSPVAVKVLGPRMWHA
jgi:hypothetical protein